MPPLGGSSQKPSESSNPVATDGPKPGVDEQIVVLRDLPKGGIRSNLVRDATDSGPWFVDFSFFVRTKDVASGKQRGT